MARFKSPDFEGRKELITSLVAAADPGHRERNVISAAGNNSSLSRHLITERQNSRGFRPLHIVIRTALRRSPCLRMSQLRKSRGKR
jgi:hypothetical protein